jgi:hypothetical protein
VTGRRRARSSSVAAIAALVAIVAAQFVLFVRPVDSATNYDEAVYLAALDALRHGQALGSSVFAAQFPGFYDLLRGLSFVTGLDVSAVRAGLLAVVAAGTVGGFLVGRRYGGVAGGLLVAALLTVAPPLDLFSFQVIADTPALALTLLALGVATLPGALAAAAAGAIFGGALTVKLTALTAAPALVWFVRGRLPAAAAGFAVAVGLELLAHAGALGDLWASGVSYHDKARSTPAVIPHPYRQILDQIPQRTPFFWLAAAAGLVAIAFALRRRPLGVWPLWLWVALSVAFLLVHKPLHYNHLIELPFTLAVAAGATLGAGLARGPGRARLALAGGLAVLLVGAYVQQWHRVALVDVPEPVTNVAAAAALARLTPATALTADDRPIISFLAARRVTGALVDLAALRFETGSLTDAKVIRDLQDVDAVVVSRTLRRHPAVLRYVASHFALRYARGGVRIWVRR